MPIDLSETIARILSRIGPGSSRPDPEEPETIVPLKTQPQLKIAVHSQYDKYISAQIVQNGEWEPFETELVQRLLNPGDVFVDIGANIGWYSIVAASAVGPAGHVYAFEPGRDNFALAARNVALNGFTNVTLERLAIADRKGRAALFLSSDNLGDHRLFKAEQKRSSESVRVVSLGEYFAAKPGPIRLVKIDTQGSEGRIFEGIPDDFVRTRNVGAFILEYWPRGLAKSGSSAEALVRRLSVLGLQCYVIQEQVRGIDPIELDILAERAHGDLRPETDLFANLLALPAANPIPDWMRSFIRSSDAPYFYPSPA